MSTTRVIGGFEIRNTTQAVATRYLRRRLDRRLRTSVFFANANFVVRCQHLRDAVARTPEFVILNDGVALDAAAWLAFGEGFKDNLNGTDFTPNLLAELGREHRVFLLGSTPDSVARAAAAFGTFPCVSVVGYQDGFSFKAREGETLDAIRRANCDILLVAMGNPLQEEWILRHRDTLAVPLVMGVGALFDFVSGTATRAPTLMRRLRLEWLHRLAFDPARLLERYTLGIARFLVLVAAQHRRGTAA